MSKESAVALLAATLAGAMPAAAAADPIEGLWKRPSTGALVEYAAQGGQFCGTVQTGEFKGDSIGCLEPDGSGGYKGKVIDLAEKKTYSGKATVSGDVLSLKGCVLLICRGEDWQRQ